MRKIMSSSPLLSLPPLRTNQVISNTDFGTGYVLSRLEPVAFFPRMPLGYMFLHPSHQLSVFHSCIQMWFRLRHFLPLARIAVFPSLAPAAHFSNFYFCNGNMLPWFASVLGGVVLPSCNTTPLKTTAWEAVDLLTVSKDQLRHQFSQSH